jgi:hypothetical protein
MQDITPRPHQQSVTGQITPKVITVKIGTVKIILRIRA